MSDKLTLTIEPRAKTGSTSARALRASGKIPAVLYGHGDAPQHVFFDARAFEDMLHKGGRTGVVTLQNGKNAEGAIVRDVKRNPVTQKIEHADLQRVSAHESVRSKLPVVTVGTALGVRDFGGVMDVVVHEVEIEGPIDRMPHQLDVDVTQLGIHQHATAGDIVLPHGFKMLAPLDTIIVSIESSKTAQAVEEAAAGTTTEQVAPEVIGGKPEETPEG